MSSSIQQASALYGFYYKNQNLWKSDQEFQQHLACINTPLPVVLRLTQSHPALAQTTAQLLHLGFHFVPWLQIAVQIEPHRFTSYVQSVCKQLMLQNAARFQEAVSMFPVLLVAPGSTTTVSHILDLCAAPGSKSMQLVDVYGNRPFALIANEMDAKRASSKLVPSVVRAKTTAVIVTSGPAQKFPSLYSREPKCKKNIETESSDGDGDGGGEILNTALEKKPQNPREQKLCYERLLFDYVLADVPCSGDGTMRKTHTNSCTLDNFDPTYATKLHKTQLKILVHGLGNLKQGGRLIYSTCSLNPVENEAVVAAALTRFHGRVELLDGCSALGDLGIEARPGLSTWKVPYWKEANELKKWNVDNLELFHHEDVVPAELLKKPYTLAKTMFPAFASRDIRSILNRCARIFPEDANTGGFFVAMLEMKSRAQIHGHGGFRDYIFEHERAKALLRWPGRAKKHGLTYLSSLPQDIVDFYGLDLNRLDSNVRFFAEINLHGEWKSIVAASKQTSTLLQAGFDTYFKSDTSHLIHAGLTVFKKLDPDYLSKVKCRWRPTSTSTHLICPIMNKRLLHVSRDTYQSLDSSKQLSIESLSLSQEFIEHSLENSLGYVFVHSKESAGNGILCVLEGKRLRAC